jgi:sugar O-acyltransferase (sialic acid O-acetyltransferase NeuD family)
MKKLAIIGSGDLGNQIAYHAQNDGHYQPIGFFDDYLETGIIRNGLPIIGKTNDALRLYDDGKYDVLMIGIGYKYFDLRAHLFNQYFGHIPFGTIVHSTAYVDKSCQLESGIIIYPGCVIDMNVVIDRNVLINVGCVIAHDSKVGRHCFLSPSVNIAGFVDIGEKVSLGIGTSVIDHIKITDNVRTGGGAVVIDDILTPGLYVGIPAKLKKP